MSRDVVGLGARVAVVSLSMVEQRSGRCRWVARVTEVAASMGGVAGVGSRPCDALPDGGVCRAASEVGRNRRGRVTGGRGSADRGGFGLFACGVSDPHGSTSWLALGATAQLR